MNKVFGFGERVAGYGQPVLNEREVRAAAGIMFLFAMIAFMNAWLAGDFQPTRLFVIAFLIDFSLRIIVNPRFSPSMILGRIMVRRQAPEWAGAPQKRFAWSIGLALALAMLYLVVIERVIGPLNLVICAICLTLLFFESAFGICLACIVYNAFHRERARDCPGGVCAADRKPVRIGLAPLAVLVLFAVAIGLTANRLPTDAPGAGPAASVADSQESRCQVPEWAIAIGHEEMWKLHNNCQ
jgi:hypothetical protein